MSFFGKEYVLESQENFDGFINSLGANLPEETKKAIASHKPTSKLVKSGDKYTLVNSQPTGVKEVTFSLGVAFDENVFGNPAKTTATLEGNTLTSVEKFDKGTITFKREYSDNQMVLTITSSLWDGVAKRIYKAA